jgi:hypothetical protein
VILTSEIELFKNAVFENARMEVFREGLILPTDEERIALGFIEVFLRVSKEMKLHVYVSTISREDAEAIVTIPNAKCES